MCSVEICAVFALPDDYDGESVAAAVRLGGTASAEQLSVKMRERVAGFKVPQHRFVVDELPLTASGKVRKHVLREQAEHGTLRVLR